MKKDEKNAEIEDFNVWEPKDPKKPFLIWGKNWEPLDIQKIQDCKSQKKKYELLRDWRENNCDEVTATEFNKRIKNNAKNRNFMGLVFPAGKRTNGNYRYAIFTGDTDFISVCKKDQKPNLECLFNHARFQGETRFLGSFIFNIPFPFFRAKICKKGAFSIFGNAGSIFKQKEGDIALQNPFLELIIEDGGALFFDVCSFPEAFTLLNLNLKNSLFWGSHIEKIRFINCEFAEEKGNFLTPTRFILADEKRDEISHRELATMYQLMKKSFEDQKDYQTAGKFYVSEMVFRQKEATGFKKYALFVYGFLAGYGESVWRTGFLLAFCIFLAGALPQIASCLSDILPYLASLSLPSSFFAKISSFSTSLAAFLSSLFAFFGSFVFFPIVFGFLFDALVFLLDSLETGAAKLLFLRDSEGKTWFDIIPRSLFIVSGFLFINAIRRRLRRS